MEKEKVEELLAKFDQIAGALVDSEDPQTKNDIAVFRKLFAQFLQEPYKVDWSRIRPMPAEQQFSYEKLPQIDAAQREAILSRLVIVKLNGGLGTTMGCAGPKSLVPLRDGLTFLDFAVSQNQILNDKFHSNVPLLLMNSFNTNQKTKEFLNLNGIETSQIQCFCQSQCPRIFADSMMPVPNKWDDALEEGWYPPGHGNVFLAMAQSSVLDQLLANGRDLAFFANIDNTGAIFDERIAKVLADGQADYIMEMTPRTAADVKGGTLVEILDDNASPDGPKRLMHLECPQVPDERIDEFCSLQTFKMFNTNNIWVNLAAIRQRLGQMKMEILANEKRLSTGQRVIQLEQSIGGAIRNFPSGRAMAICVPRCRFLPVKSTRDLFRMRSPCLFQFNPSECLLRQRRPNLPEVELSSEFAKLADFERRIPQIPVIGDQIRRISFQGDVWLGRGVEMRGINVAVHAKNAAENEGNGETRVRVPDNSIIGAEGEEEEKGEK